MLSFFFKKVLFIPRKWCFCVDFSSGTNDFVWNLLWQKTGTFILLWVEKKTFEARYWCCLFVIILLKFLSHRHYGQKSYGKQLPNWQKKPHKNYSFLVDNFTHKINLWFTCKEADENVLFHIALATLEPNYVKACKKMLFQCWLIQD